MIEKTEKEIMQNWKGDINNSLVSVICTSYNHEKYISEAIDSFLMQETDFPFEIIIHDDASTDNTAKIISDYKEKFPTLIKCILQKNNQYSINPHLPFKNLISESKGKYIAICEGDDYWIDKSKIYKQVQYLKDKEDCYLIFTPAKQIQNGKKDFIRNQYNNKHINKINTKWVIKKGGGFYPTCSVMIRKELFDNLPNWFYKHSTGDYPLAILASLKGRIGYLNDCTSIYRSQPNSISHIKESNEKIEQKCKNNIEFFEMLKNNNIIDEKLKKEMIKKEIYIQFVKTKNIWSKKIFNIGLKNFIKLIFKLV